MDIEKLLSNAGEMKSIIGGMEKTECVLAYAFLKDQVDRANRVKIIVGSVMDDVTTRMGQLGVDIEEDK